MPSSLLVCFISALFPYLSLYLVLSIPIKNYSMDNLFPNFQLFFGDWNTETEQYEIGVGMLNTHVTGAQQEKPNAAIAGRWTLHCCLSFCQSAHRTPKNGHGRSTLRCYWLRILLGKTFVRQWRTCPDETRHGCRHHRHTWDCLQLTSSFTNTCLIWWNTSSHSQ